MIPPVYAHAPNEHQPFTAPCPACAAEVEWVGHRQENTYVQGFQPWDIACPCTPSQED